MPSRRKVLLEALMALTLLVAGTAATDGIAEAKGKPVTITLSCTNAVGSASATVQLQNSIFGGPASGTVTLDRGTDRVSGLSINTRTLKAASLPAGFVSYSICQSVSTSGGCVGTSTRPLTTPCNVGITLTVS